MKNLGFALMTVGLICMAAGAGGSDSGTCSLWVSVLWVIAGMISAQIGAKMIEYGR